MSTPRVSVVMPVYNAAHYLGEALESVRAQSFEDWELVLVDDGSTDGSLELGLRAAQEHPDRIRLIRHSNGDNLGSSTSRNRGLQAARGALVSFLDADDVWFPNALTVQLAMLESYPDAAMVYAAAELWYSWTGEKADSERDVVPDLLVAADILHGPKSLLQIFLAQSSVTPCTGTVMVRRDIAMSLGGFEDGFAGLFDDQVFYAKVALQHGIVRSPETILRYRQHPGSMCATRTDEVAPARARYLDWMEQYADESGVADSRLTSMIAEQRAKLAGEEPACGRTATTLPVRVARRVVRSVLPARVSNLVLDPPALLQALRRAPGIRTLRALGWRRGTPLHDGGNVGTAIVRWYWNQFLEVHCEAIAGRVLEIGDTGTVRRWGGSRVRSAEALDVSAHSPEVAIVADLSRADHVPGERYDCFLVQFTMHVIPDAEAAFYHAIRLLKPGGQLLINFSCVDYQFPQGLDMSTGAVLWVHWCFTPLQVHNMLRRVGLTEADYQLHTYGNLLSRVAYQLNVQAEEMTRAELVRHDPGHPVLVCVRATRPINWSPARPVYRDAWTPEARPAVLNERTGVYA
ncbi:MAG TPA: glycosyltransferase [Gemmatimonas sp.]|nr:glycosyltransferase [Gemmatimonas sp.]